MPVGVTVGTGRVARPVPYFLQANFAPVGFVMRGCRLVDE